MLCSYRSCLASIFLLALVVDTANGQLLRRRREAVILAPPPVQAHVGQVSLVGPRYLLPRRRAAAAAAAAMQAEAAQGQPAPRELKPQPDKREAYRPDAEVESRHGPKLVPPRGDGPAPTPAPDPAEAEYRFPEEADLQTMQDGQLLNALLNASYRLDLRLERLTTGDGWQRYLGLPDDALPPPSAGQVKLGMQSLQTTLKRFESVEANPEYEKIASLISFNATHDALRHVVDRFTSRTPADGPVLGTPASAFKVEAAELDATSGEALPLPEPDPAPATATPGAERSVLKRTTRS